MLVDLNLTGKNCLLVGSHFDDSLLKSLSDSEAIISLKNTSNPQKSIADHYIQIHEQFKQFEKSDLANTDYVFLSSAKSKPNARDGLSTSVIKAISRLARLSNIPIDVVKTSSYHQIGANDIDFLETTSIGNIKVALTANNAQLGQIGIFKKHLLNHIKQYLPLDLKNGIDNFVAIRDGILGMESDGDGDDLAGVFLGRILSAIGLQGFCKLTEASIKLILNDYMQDNSIFLKESVSFNVIPTPSKLKHLTLEAFQLLSNPQNYVIIFSDELAVIEVDIMNIFMNLGNFYHLKYNEKRTKSDLAECVKQLAETAYVEKKSVVLLADDYFLRNFADHPVLAGLKAKFVHGLYSNIVQHHEKAISVSISPILSTCSSPSTLSASISSLPSYSPKITPSTSIPTYPLTNKKRLPNLGTASFTKGLELVSRTAFNWSQIVFVYPSLIRRSSDEQIIHDWADQKKFLNVDGGVPSVVTLSSRFGAGSVIHGALTENEIVSVLAPASSLKLMIPSLNAIASKNYPVVLHISTGDSINPTTLQTKSIHDLSDIYSIFNTGFVIVASSTLQDIHDIGLVLSIMSRFGKWSIAHLYDGVKIGQEARSVNVFKYDELLSLIQSVKETGFIEELENGENFFDIFNKVLSFLSPSLGNEYKPFEYFGSSSPDVVIINVLGVASTYFESVVSQLVQGKHKIGVVFIRLIRPWSMSHFIEAIPKTASKIIIIEHENTNQQYSQLYLDVVASFHHHPTPVDIIKSVHFQDETLAGLTYDGVKQFVTHLVKRGVTDDLVIHPTSSNIDPSLFQTNENTVSSIKFIEYDVKVNKEKTLVDELVHVLSAFDENIKVNVSHRIDSLNSSLSLTNLALGKGDSSSDYADYIGIHDIKLLHHVAGKVGENSCVLLNTQAKNVEELLDHGIVSKTLIYEWVTKKVTLFLVDVDAIVDEYTLFIPKHWKLHYRTFIFAGLMLKITSSIYYNHRKLNGEVLIQKLRDLNIGIELENGVAIGRTLLGALDDAFLSLSHVTHEESLKIVDNLEGEDDDKTQTSSLPSSIEFNNTLVSTTPFIADAISKSAPFVLDQEEEKFYSITKIYKSMWSYIFPEAFKTKKSVSRPDIKDKHFVVTVQENRRLTPVDYDRNVFHIEMDISGTGLKYAVGEALGVYGHNDPEDVKRFLEFYGVDANEIYQVSSNGEEAEFRSIEQVLVQVLDLFGKPGKKFYQALLPFTTNHQERSRMAELIHSTVDFTEFVVKETPTYADVLHLFPSAHPPIEKLLQLIPAIKPRHYSIASSMNMHPTSVHLLVVLVEWKTHSGVYKKGQCTRYLSTMKVGDKLTVCVKPSVMKLPELHSQPVVMAGLGTGMAPFRAFIQERAYQKSKGIAIGSMMLYFGSRHRNLEYLYGEELELYHEAGILTHLGLAFSRDQAEKVYIQHKMKEDSKILGDVMMEEEGAFYLCGPTWPVPDVKEAWVGAFGEKGIKKEHASQLIEKLKGEERYILEVY